MIFFDLELTKGVFVSDIAISTDLPIAMRMEHQMFHTLRADRLEKFCALFPLNDLDRDWLFLLVPGE